MSNEDADVPDVINSNRKFDVPLDGTLLPQALCKRAQIVGCFMLLPFAHPVAFGCVLLGIVAQSLKPVKLLATCKRTQQILKLLGVVRQQSCIRLHGALRSLINEIREFLHRIFFLQ